MDQNTILIRFAVAFVAAFSFGLVRQKLGKPIGFGTFIFLALGSCALAMTAVSHNEQNPLPLLSAIVTGVGFLGAGALFRSGERVVGFTSAATIWIFAVLGLTIGLGEYLIAGLVYGSIAAVSVTDWWLERRWFGVHNRKLTIEVPIEVTDTELQELGLPAKANASLVEFNRQDGTITLTYLVRRPTGDQGQFVQSLVESAWVRRSSIES